MEKDMEKNTKKYLEKVDDGLNWSHQQPNAGEVSGLAATVATGLTCSQYMGKCVGKVYGKSIWKCAWKGIWKKNMDTYMEKKWMMVPIGYTSFRVV